MKIGNVIRIPVQDTIPPKVKYLIVVGVTSESLATIFINSELKPLHLSSIELQSLQFPLSSTVCTFLKKDSFADCSDIADRNKAEINIMLQKDPGRNEGAIPMDIMGKIIVTIKKAKSITVAIKKKYNLLP
ncbi:MAG: hypothetical protein WKF91_21070 [Segetibacter sp.]